MRHTQKLHTALTGSEKVLRRAPTSLFPLGHPHATTVPVTESVEGQIQTLSVTDPCVVAVEDVCGVVAVCEDEREADIVHKVRDTVLTLSPFAFTSTLPLFFALSHVGV